VAVRVGHICSILMWLFGREGKDKEVSPSVAVQNLFSMQIVCRFEIIDGDVVSS
jgi:hypothetical protein